MASLNLRRWRPKVAPVVVAGLLLVSLLGGGAYWWRNVRQRAHVAVPVAGSTPVQVVEAYVAAEDARDRSTVRALSSLDNGALDHLRSVRLLATPLEVAEPGVIGVSVDLDVRGGDETFADGRKSWGFSLRKGGQAGWLIVDEGQG